MCQGVFVVFAVTAPWYTSKSHTQHPLPLEPAPSSREQQQQHLCRLSQWERSGAIASPAGAESLPRPAGTAAERAWRGFQNRQSTRGWFRGTGP